MDPLPDQPNSAVASGDLRVRLPAQAGRAILVVPPELAASALPELVENALRVSRTPHGWVVDGDSEASLGPGFREFTGWMLRDEGSALDPDDTLSARTSWLTPELRIVSQPSGRPGQLSLPLTDGASVVVGRGTVDLALADERISRRHFSVHCADGRHAVEDLRSSTGTRLNGHALEPGVRKPLAHGDRIEAGMSVLEYVSPQEELRRQIARLQEENIDAAQHSQRAATADPGANGGNAETERGAGTVPPPAPPPAPPNGRRRRARASVDPVDPVNPVDPVVEPDPPRRPPRERWLLWAAVLMAAVALGLLGWTLVDDLDVAAEPQGAEQQGAEQQSPAPIEPATR